MKELLVMTLVLSIPFIMFAESDQNIVKSEITGITVYPEGAVIYRVAKVNLIKGFNTIVIDNLTTSIDPQTIQIGGQGNFEILSMKFELFYPYQKRKPKGQEVIEDSLSDLGDSQFILLREKQALEEEYSMILINNSLSGTSGISVSEIDAMANYYRKRFRNIGELKLKNKNKLDSILIQQKRLKSVLKGIEEYKDEKVGRIIVEINSDQIMNAELKCSFYTSMAGWTPIYNIKATSGKDEIEVDYNALVNQTTGVKWENVKLVLSTTKPNLNNQKPEMHPWYLDYYSSYSLGQYQNKLIDKGNTSVKQTVTEEDFKNMVVRSETDVAKNTAGVYSSDGGSGNLNIRGSRADANYYYIDGMKVSGSSSLPSSYNTYAQRTYRQEPPKYAKGELVFNALNTSYDILNTYSIPSNSNSKQVFIKQVSIPVSFSHYSVPSLERESFLTASIQDWGSYDLIPGNATLFYNNTYVGQTFVLTHTLDDILQVSLGRDQSVMVEQKKVVGLSTTKKNGGNIKKKLVYEISARNNGKSDVEIVIYDRVPISKRKEIIVAVEDIAKAEYNKETGILKWKKVIKSGEQLTWRISYEVKYPKGKIVNL
jgi:hypothetical protein